MGCGRNECRSRFWINPWISAAQPSGKWPFPPQQLGQQERKQVQEAPFILQCMMLPVFRPSKVSENVSISPDHLVCGQAGFGWCADPRCGGVPLQGSPVPVSSITPFLLRFARRPASFAQIFSKFPLVPIVSFLSWTANNKWSFSPRR